MGNGMNYVMVSPNFPPNYENFAVRLKDKGVNVLGVGDESYDRLSQTLKDSLTEYYWVADMEDYSQIYEAIRFFTEKYGQIHRIESHNEHWMANDARIRSAFDIFGLKEEDMERIKRKSSMKKIFRENNVPVARGRVFKDEDDARELANALGYPIIVKPDIGVGATDTWKVESEEELDEILSDLNEDVDFIMEEFIQGDVITLDGLTDQDGNVIFYSSLILSNPVLDYAQGEDVCFYVSRDMPEDLVDIGIRSVEAFGLKERFFHHEFFRTETGDIIALEINCRPPGGFILDMMNYANSLDLYDEYANIVVGQDFQSQVTRPYNALYIDRKADVDYENSSEQIMDKYGDQAIFNQTPPGIADIMGDYAFIIKTKDAEDHGEIIDYILANR